MKQFRRILAVLLASMMFVSCLPFVSAADEAGEIYDVEITNDEKQVMDGLGGAIAFNKAYPLRMWSEQNPELCNELMDLMFDEETGIGMDIVRIIIGSGGITNASTGAEWGNRWYDGPSDTIWPEEGEENIVWNQPDWEDSKASFDPDQVWFCQLAQEYGVHQIYATAWTPPYWMKTNSSVLGTNSAKLRDDCYDDYAKYLMEFALGYYREFGIHITHISATNECEAAHSSYDGFIFKGTDYTKFVKDYYIQAYEEYAPKFAELGIEPPLICGPEGTNLGVSAGSQYGGMMQDEEVMDFMDVFTTHLYGSAGMFEKGPQNAPANNWPEWLNNYTLWQTEYMTQVSGDSSAKSNTQLYKKQTITDACYWANLITNCFTSNPGFSGYLWWWPWGNNGCDGSDLIRAVHNGAGQGDGDTATAMGLYRIFKRFYSFGNFARFVNDGDIRVDATRVPVTGINLSAYKDPTTGEFKIVVVNNSANDQTLSFNFAEDFPLDAEAAVAYRTSASENMALLDAIAIEDGSFVAEIPAYTVITFVPDKGEDNLPGLDFRRDIWSTLEAEDNDGMSEGTELAGNGIIAADGNFVEFDRINFADGSANGAFIKRHILSIKAVVKSAKGGVIVGHIGGVDGPVVTEIGIPAGNGSAYATYEAQVDTGDMGAYGIKDLYFTFLGDGEDLFEIDRFEFDENYINIDNLIENGNGVKITTTTRWGRTTTSVAASTENWSSTAAITSTTEENYNEPDAPTSGTSAYAFKVAGREEGTKAFGNIKGKLVEGETYSFLGFFMPGEAKNASFKVGTPTDKTAKFELNALDENGEVVYSTVIAERTGFETCKWGEVGGSFVFPLAEDEYASLQLAVSDDSVDPFYFDYLALTVDADKSGLIEFLKTGADTTGLSPKNVAAYENAVAAGWAAVVNPNADLALINSIFEDVEKALANEAYNSVSLSMDGDIGVNFYLDLDAYDGVERVELTYSDATRETATPKTEVYTEFEGLKTENLDYKFSVKAAAPQMTDNISIIVYGANDAILYYVNTSVKDVAESYIEAYADNARLSNLCRNLLTYGGYAQEYFDYSTALLANEKQCADIDEIVTAETVAGYNTNANDLDVYDGFAYKAQTFSCRTNSVMRYAFTAPAGADMSAYTAEFAEGGEGMEITVTSSGSQLIVNVSGIAAAQLDDEFVIAVSYGEDEVYELTSCALAYVKAVLNNESASEELVNLAKSIYVYNLAANEYFG